MKLTSSAKLATREFWDGIRRHEFLIQLCNHCSAKIYPPTIVCPKCLSDNLGWAKANGRGKIYSFSTVYDSPPPGFEAKVPFVVALIELEEGVRVLGNVVECNAETLRIGSGVELAFEKTNDEMTLPKFRPASVK